MTKPPSEEQRRILAQSFEQGADGYTYYRNAWSRGIPVTEAEREAYLAIPAIGSRRTWLSAIAGRPSVPRRAYFPTVFNVYSAMPARTGIAFLSFGTFATFIAQSTDSRLVSAFSAVSGIALVSMGLVVLCGRLRSVRKG
jgi:hypothetical protein